MRRVCLLAVILLPASLYLLAGARAGISAPIAVTATVPLVTMTVRPNGCTVHVVGAGQTLWAIALAYGVKVDDIRGLNGMGTDSTAIYPGDTLVIRCMPLTPTVEDLITITSTPTKRTSLPARTTATPTRIPTRAMVTAPPATTDVAAESGPPGALAAGALILTVGTLLVLLIFGFARRR